MFDAGLKASEVQSSDPPVEALAEAGVIPADAEADRPSVREVREQTLAVLEDIRDILEAS